MTRMKVFVALIVMAVGVREIDSSADTMKDLTSEFLKLLDECKKELNLPDNIINDFYNYWKEDFSLLNRDTGCAMLCMSKKLELMDNSGKFHHGNAEDFAVKHGAAADVASKLVGILHECETKYEAMDDECMKVLEIAKCFSTNIHQLNWTPNMDVVITEVLTDV